MPRTKPPTPGSKHPTVKPLDLMRWLVRLVTPPGGVVLDPLLLSRTRATPPQAELPLKERARNVRGAFACAGNLAGKRVLLVDDVMTTGATLREAARILKLHGAGTITVAVAARALCR